MIIMKLKTGMSFLRKFDPSPAGEVKLDKPFLKKSSS
jgi:hypothetical protein